MRTFIFLLLLAFSLGSCKKYCFMCTNGAGQEIQEKCFKSQDDMNAYNAAEVGKPDSERCQ